MAFLALLSIACKKEERTSIADSADSTNTVPVSSDTSKENADKEQITQLIRKTLIWADSDKTIHLLGATQEKDSIATGFDLAIHNKNLEALKATGLFAQEFINNYDNIIKTLDRKIKSKELDPWNVYELPTFSFANDVDPWCNCQDYPGEWKDAKVDILRLNGSSGEFEYYFGTEQRATDTYSYRFNAVKENGSWKISYMEGFDYKTSIKTDGE